MPVTVVGASAVFEYSRAQVAISTPTQVEFLLAKACPLPLMAFKMQRNTQMHKACRFI